MASRGRGSVDSPLKGLVPIHGLRWMAYLKAFEHMGIEGEVPCPRASDLLAVQEVFDALHDLFEAVFGLDQT